MLDIFIFETSQQIESLEEVILSGEKSDSYNEKSINEIFRIMHTIKSSAAMMMYENIASLSHSIEDLFYYIREEKPRKIDCSALADIVLNGADFIKIEIEKIKNGFAADGSVTNLVEDIKTFLDILKNGNPPSEGVAERPIALETDVKKQYYISPDKTVKSSDANIFKTVIFFNEGCEMENIRAFSVIHNLKGIAGEIYYIPEDIIDNDQSVDVIRQEGFKIYLKTELTYEELHKLLMQTIFLRSLELTKLEDDSEIRMFWGTDSANDSGENDKRLKYTSVQAVEGTADKEVQSAAAHQNFISVSVPKLDKLMDLMGEMVIAEAMVIQNPELASLELDGFMKAARHLDKITNEIQDVVMSIRMVPLATTFHKMQRVVRDMCKKLGKEVRLDMSGEETEVDKNIIEHISDPLMHLVRNAIDHGIEAYEERLAKGKPRTGTVKLEAKNAGSDVLIIVRDDGEGLNREKILERAKENNLLYKPEVDMNDREVFNMILLPGFSTKDDISEYSGRGVGMDVVTKNIEVVGGSVSVDSVPEGGTSITLRIPLTLAIMDGMNIKVGNARYTMPTISVRESFKPDEKDIITDPDGNEMVMVRGQCYSIFRLHKKFGINTDITEFEQGIMIMIEQGGKSYCIFADELLGQQQVVIKSLPEYIKKSKKIRGLAGCTLLGNGSISLILDVGSLAEM